MDGWMDVKPMYVSKNGWMDDGWMQGKMHGCVSEVNTDAWLYRLIVCLI